MEHRVTPMIHVPNVRETIDWYESIGFIVIGTGEDDGEMVWAELSFGKGRVLFSSGGQASTRDRRDVDLYVHTENIDRLFLKMDGRVKIQVGIHNTFYGMREFIIRDINGFWITFGEFQRGEV